MLVDVNRTKGGYDEISETINNVSTIAAYRCHENRNRKSGYHSIFIWVILTYPVGIAKIIVKYKTYNFLKFFFKCRLLGEYSISP